MEVDCDGRAPPIVMTFKYINRAMTMATTIGGEGEGEGGREGGRGERERS